MGNVSLEVLEKSLNFLFKKGCKPFKGLYGEAPPKVGGISFQASGI